MESEGGAERWMKAGGALLCLLAVVWMAWVMAGLAWLVSGHDSSALRMAPAESRRVVAPTADISLLASYNLFGQSALVPATGAAENAPDTSLQLRLTGVFVSVDPSRSSAIVADSSGLAGKLYRVEETLPGGATLESVFEDRILLRRTTGSEILRFEKTSLLDGKPAARSGSLSSGAQQGAGTGTAVAPDVRQMLADAAAAMTDSPVEFLREMGLRRNGRGYEVSADAPENLRNTVGLKPGDRLLSVNGRQLGDAEADRALLDELKSGGTARVEIQRGGQIVTVERKF